MTTSNIFDLTDTWNAGGTTFTAIKMNVTDTASAAGSLLLDLQVAGSSKFSVTKGGVAAGTSLALTGAASATGATAAAAAFARNGTAGTGIYFLSSSNLGIAVNSLGKLNFSTTTAGFDSAYQLGWFSGAIGTTVDTILTRAAAASLQIGAADVASGAVAQLLTAQGNTGSTVVGPDFTIRGPGGGSSTAVGGKLILSGGLTSAAAGTGGAIEFWTAPAAAGNAGVSRWSINSVGHFLANTDNTYDIGASAATRPRDIYAGSTINAAGAITGGGLISTTNDVRVGAARLFYWSTRSQISSPANSQILLTNAAGTDFDRLQFGVATSAAGAIARDGAGLKIVGGDGTSVSWIKVPGVAVASLPSAATAGAGARSFVTDALTPAWGATVANGGAVAVPVYSDGTNWKVG